MLGGRFVYTSIFSIWGRGNGGKCPGSGRQGLFSLKIEDQLRPEGRNPRVGTRLRGPEVLPRNSTPRFGNSGSRTPPSRGPLEAQKGSPQEAFQGSRRGVSVFKGAGKEGGPLKGP